MIKKIIYISYILFFNLESKSQNTLEIKYFNDFDSLIIYETDEYYYTLKDSSLVIKFKIEEPKFLMLLFLKTNSRSKQYRIWVEPNINRLVEYKLNVFEKMDKSWLDYSDTIFNAKNIALSRNKFRKYLVQNKNFLSLYFGSRLMVNSNKEELKNLSYYFLKDSTYYSQYPLYFEIKKFINQNLNITKKCLYTNDSFVNFNFRKSDSLIYSTFKFNKKYTYLYFSFPSCKPCKKSTHYLDSLYRDIDLKNIDFYYFSIIDLKNKVEFETISKKYIWESITDYEGFYSDIISIYNVKSYPTLLIFKDRKLINKYDDANSISFIKDLNNPELP